ncbi:membrane protease YdiL (CAAX protease family) [Chryseobacterium defluvii]|uniref:Membrane protease YdiL (CAAX protease family) n=1 Tax=Chryseobacterium defluvii TaxID=160396 RepID=A0A840KD99_9FLAO|nr:CPBP family intramembrane glutamic endopeptidase [Chryseobacterium defluvii]MBB4807371.1 membrane protease YdiL (CAAX protease family) [Chryseobacterium defluvii]
MKNKSIGSKILYFPLTKILVGIIVVSGTYGITKNFRGGIARLSFLSKDWNNLIVTIISTILAVGAYIYLYKVYEKRNITEFSKNNIFKNLIIGALLGAILQSLTILFIYIKGGYSIISINPLLYIISPLTMAFASATFEEILFRGIIFRITEEKLGSYISLLISAIIFGLLHFTNPNSSIGSSIGLAIQAGLLLGAAYIYSRNLWFPIAIHFAWNFTQSGVFGATISGIKASKSLIVSNINGENWYTGGQFGPEGSIQATIFCFTATLILMVLCHKKRRIIKPYWKRSLLKHDK